MLHRLAVLMTLAAALAATSVSAREEFGWVLVSKGPTVATSGDELSRSEEWTSNEDRVLFVRFGQDEYLIRDRVTLDRADELVAPIRELAEKAREIRPPRGEQRGDKLGRREWKERLRPIKEKRRELLLQVSPRIEALARAAISKGQAQRLN
jgi:hypothetical protein